METSASFGYWMRRQRKALDLTQQALADQVGYSLATLKKIEADERRPSRELAERLADYLAIPADQRQRFLECARGFQPVDNLPLASEPASLPRRHSNLPRPLTSFIGREKEIRQIEHLVRTTRLITITGPGGVGKTRLAIQVAGALTSQFTDGVWWVGLASLFETTPSKKRLLSQLPNLPIPQTGDDAMPMGAELVAQAVAKSLRIPESPGLPVLEGVIEYLLDRQLLLVLDNCEHLIEACSILAERLLINCPQVTILATSREALGVPGEKAWPLQSLSLPEPGRSLSLKDITHFEAVSLFIERAGDIRPGYQPSDAEVTTIAQICHHLDGIPLAIELAAARMNLLSAQEIAARLDHRFSLLAGRHRMALPRHQTLQAAIEWSYDLLEQNEQVLFRRLSVFPGSFTLEACEAICAGQDLRSDELLFLIGRLVDKSLVTVQVSGQITDMPTRYRFLETIRSFGRIKLGEAKEIQSLRDRHAEYFVNLVETALPNLHLQDQVHWFRLLQAENENLHAVVAWSAESDQAENALRLVGALWFFWWSQSSSSEGSDLALKALALPSAMQFKEYRARALTTAGCLQWVLGDFVSARQSLKEAESILRRSDDKASLAVTMQFLGLVFTNLKEYDLADKAFKESLAITWELGDVHAQIFLFFQGDVYLQKGEHSKAKKVYEENAKILRKIGNKVYAAYPLRRLGYLALEQNDISSARDYFYESLTTNGEVGDKRGVYASLTSLAALAIHLEKPVVAARLYGAVESGLESLSINLFYQDQVELGQIRRRLRTSLNETIFDAAYSEGWMTNEEQAMTLVEEIFEGVK